MQLAEKWVSLDYQSSIVHGYLRGPPDGAPLPGKPGGGAPPGNPPDGNPPNPPGGGGPPTPAAGPLSPTGIPRPAGLLIPGPAAIVGGAVAPGALAPNRVDGSAGGGPSTEHEMMCVPRTIAKPSVRFSSVSTRGAGALPGAACAPFVCFLLTRRNSSVSAKTRFMCYHTLSQEPNVSWSLRTLSKASICPVIWRPSFRVTLIR